MTNIIDNLLFGDDIVEVDDDLDDLSTAQITAVVDATDDRITAYRRILADVFPLGTPEEKLNRGPMVIARKVGDHWVGVVGAIAPGDNEPTWRGYWRQNVTSQVFQPQQQHKRRRGAGATIEKHTRPIRGESGFIGWTSWVHGQICKVSSETIRTGLHPDNFMEDPPALFRAGYDLHLINATLNDVEGMLAQRLPWRAGKTNLGSLCSIFLPKVPEMPQMKTLIGSLAVQQKDDYWRYGGKLDMAQISPIFAMGPFSPWKFNRKIALKACKDMDEVITHAERLYATELFKFLVQFGCNVNLRHRGE